MRKNILLAVLGLFFALPALGQIIDVTKNGRTESVEKLPVVRVGVGMTLKELQTGSTFSFEVEPGKENETQLLYVLQPYKFIYVDGHRELVLTGIGGEGFLTVIMTTNGQVDNINVTVQNRKLALDEALTRAEYIYSWFHNSGFSLGPKPRLFYINRLRGGYFSNPIKSFSEARVHLLDATEKIENIDLFSLTEGSRGLTLNLKNSRRMKAQFNEKLNDESHSLNEQEYYLNLFITSLH